MKKLKLLSIAALTLLLGGLSLTAQEQKVEDNLQFTVSTGFESEYVYRGEELADNVATLGLEVQYKALYAGLIGISEVTSLEDFDGEVDLYIGAQFGDVLGASLDVGVLTYTYPNATTSLGQTNYSIEPYVGIVFDDLLLTPSGYVYYDIQREAITLEARLSETFTTENSLPLIGKISITPSAYFGYTDINDFSPKGLNIEEAYQYAGVNLNVSFNLGPVLVSGGPRYSHTDDSSFDANELYWGTNVALFF
jgi:uncharacterized protein (TIGR02001 family)